MKYKRRRFAIFLASESLGPNNFGNFFNGLNISEFMIRQRDAHKTNIWR